MLRQGPIPLFVHGVIEYAAAVLFLAAPFLFDFDSDGATAVSIVVGVALLFLAAVTDGPTGLARTLPVSIHMLVDFALAVVLIAAPFLFGFSDNGTATAFFIVAGAAHLLITVGTRFRRAPAEARGANP